MSPNARVRMGGAFPAMLISAVLLAAAAPWPAGAGAAPAAPWQATGWGGGGFFWSCAFHPTKEGVIYMGGDVGGAYKTEDGGKHWRFINRGLADYAVYALATSKSQPDTLFAGTVSGLCKSTDAGEHWTFLEATAKGKLDITMARRASVRPIAVDPTDPKVVYAGSRHGRLYKSQDGGRTWHKLDYLQAFADQPRPTPPAAFRGKGCLALTYSSEAGDWNRNGRIERFLAEADWTGRKKMTARVLVPAGAPKLQAQLVVQSGAGWLWQQSQWVDGRQGEWTEVSLDLTGLKHLDAVQVVYVVIRSPEAAYRGPVYVDAVAVHTEADSAVAGGEAPVPQGVDLLGDWEKVGDADGWRANRKIKDALFVTEARQSGDLTLREKGAIAAVAVAEKDPKRVFVASSAYGLLRSTDGGSTWTQLATPRSAACVAVAPSDADTVYAAFGQEGIRRSTDGGTTWAAASTGIKQGCVVREVAIHPTTPSTVYCIGSMGWEGHFYLSTDGGHTWEESRTVRRDFEADPTIPDDYGGRAKGTCPVSAPANLVVSPCNPRHLFIAANWRPCFSPDGGRTWEERDRGCDITCVTDIRFHGGNTYVTAMDEGLLVSPDRGATWRQLTPLKYDTALSGHQWRVWVGSAAGATRIVATNSLWEKPFNQVLLSSDGGKTFRATRRGLPAQRPTVNTMWGQGYPRGLAVDPKDPQTLYLGIDGDAVPSRGQTGGGVFKSTDGGESWTQLPNQPASRRCFYGLAVDPTDSRRLYWGACGNGGGLYRSDDAGASWHHVFRNEAWIFNLAVSPSGVVYCPGANLWRSTDHGATWRKLTAFTDQQVTVGLAIDPRDEKRLWISRVTWGTAAVGGVYRTKDGGATWTDVTADLPYCKPTILRFDPATGELWAGGVGLFKLKQ